MKKLPNIKLRKVSNKGLDTKTGETGKEEEEEGVEVEDDDEAEGESHRDEEEDSEAELEEMTCL